MTEYRRAKPGEWAKYVSFANTVFGKGQPGIHFPSLIEKVYDESVDSAAYHMLAVDERGIVGLVAVLPNEVRVGQKHLRTGYLGTVSVSEAARGEGHMKTLMRLQDEAMKAAGTDIAFLSGNRRRYEYYGYTKGGISHSFIVRDVDVKHALRDVDAENVVIVQILPGTSEEAQAAAMHDALPVAHDRSRFGFAIACRTFDFRPFSFVRNGHFLGYITANAEKNVLGEAVSESPEALKVMLKAWFRFASLKSVSLSVSDEDRANLRSLNLYADTASTQNAIQLRIFNRRRVVDAYLTLKSTYTRLADGSMDFDVEGERFRVCVKDNTVTVSDTCEDPVVLSGFEADMLFSYTGDYEGRLQTPQNWFPLPIYVGEADAF